MPFDTPRKFEFQKHDLGLSGSYLASAYQFVNRSGYGPQGGKDLAGDRFGRFFPCLAKGLPGPT